MCAKKKANASSLPQEFFDIVPDEQRYWHYVWRRANGLLADYSFTRVDLAPVELADTFIRPVAKSSPDLKRRLITMRSHSTQLALRADMPASLMRVYLQYGMHAQPHPVKLFASGPTIVPERTRQQPMRFQLGVQTIGDDSEAVDAELLFLGCRIIESLNLGSFLVRINSLGDATNRPTYERALRDFFKQHQKEIGAQVSAAVKEHPFHGLALLAKEKPELAKDAPQAVDYLSDASRHYFKRLLEFLDEGEVPYLIDNTLVTTDDFATQTLWEFALDPVPSEEGQEAEASLPVIRGGRMDRLCGLLDGPSTPASGWTMDMDAVIARLKAKQVTLPDAGPRPKVFLSQLGDAAKKRSLMLFEEIRKSGIGVRYSLSRDTIKGQLRMAARMGVKFALIFGQKEALEGTVIVREMETGIQETIPQEKIIDELKKRLKNK